MANRALISAIICTHNGSRLLRRAIESLRHQTLAPELYEILVIDNRSRDSTRAVVERLIPETPMLRYVYEQQLGLSHARNRGVTEATAPYIAFLDDDAYASPDWLARIVDAFEHVQPPPAAVGGKIELDWQLPAPAWIPDFSLRSLSRIDYSPTPRFLNFTELEYPFGANMAFRKQQLVDVGMFNPALGRIGSTLLSNEEKAVFSQFHFSGMPVYYEPAAQIYHTVKAKRLTRRFFITRQYWQGISDLIWSEHAPSCNFRKKSAKEYRRETIRQARRVFFPRKTTRPGARFCSASQAAYFFGCFVQSRRLERSGK